MAAVLVLLAALHALAACAEDVPILIDRLDGDAGIEAVLGGELDERFVAEDYAAVTPSRRGPVWYRIRLAHDWEATAPPVLSIADPQGLSLQTWLPPAYERVARDIYGTHPNHEFTRHALVVVLPRELRAHEAFYLRVDRGIATPRRVAVRPIAEARARDLVDARLDVLFPAIQLATLLVMLSFFVVLRDRVYAYFVGQMLFIVLFEFYQYGLGHEVPPFDLLARLGERASWLMASLAAALAIDFARQFLGLGHIAARLDRVLAALRWPLAALACLALLPFAHGWWVIDVLALVLLLVAPLLLAAGLVAWQQGGHRGGYYLCAWVPGLLCVIVRAVQLSLDWPQPPWLEFAMPAAFAYASVVLAFGLADHIVSVRHERDVAHRLAEYDGLTGVLNRRAILARLRAAFLAARDRGRPLAVLFVDLDHFKRINDSFGHRAGDQCLRAVIAPIASELRQGDALGRYGGEEFIAVLPGAGIASAEGVAERIRRRVERLPLMVSGTRVGLTISIGVATIDAQTATADELIEHADAALYRSKSGGRNRASTHGAGPSAPGEAGHAAHD